MVANPVKILATLLLGFAIPAAAATLEGLVVGVTDGDTITVLVEKKPVKIRIAKIDAPESKQPYGTRSKQALSDLCYLVVAEVEVVDRDHYRRPVGRVRCAGRDVATEQVRSGMAWVFERYSAANSPLYPLQAEARAARRGLWADRAPVAPWEWRRSNNKPN